MSRRALLGGGLAVAGALGAGYAVEQGVLPGRPWLQEHLGLNGPAGTIPDIAAGPVLSGSFESAHRPGTTGWSILRPPHTSGPLPVVIALHPLGHDHADVIERLGLDRFLAAAVAAGAAPFAIATVDGGTTYWHPRPDGEDAGTMVVEELLPLLEQHRLETSRVGLLGWSMGGYGVLRLAGLLGADRVAGLVAASPAIWTDPASASESGFADAREYEQFTVFGHQTDLGGIPVRIDCGTGDPFYRDVQDYVAAFDRPVTSTFEPGGHDADYWRRMLPDELAFLAAKLPAGGRE